MSGIGAASPHSGMPSFNTYPYHEYPDPFTPPGTTNSSPRGGYAAFHPPPMRPTSTQSPQRPATRGHFHSVSTSATPVFCGDYASPRPPTASPRYNSEGHYSTANVSNGLYSRNFPPYAGAPQPYAHSRRHSFIPTRDSTPSGESDEEFFNRDGTIDYTTASSGRRRRTDYHVSSTSMGGGYGPGSASRVRRRNSFADDSAREHATDRVFSSQAGPYSPMHHEFYDHAAAQYHHHHYAQDMPSRPTTTSRRPSMTTPQRPATTMPRSQHHGQTGTRKFSGGSRPTESRSPQPQSPQQQQPPPATEQDAINHQIPAGFSLKNWDPRKKPILLLGSVFDANSLGKWIYDWTVHTHSASQREAEHAGHLWLYVIKLYGKIHAGDHVINRVRNPKDKDVLEKYLDRAEELTGRLGRILRACEKAMLSTDTRKGTRALGSSSGVEFVKTMFGRDKQLSKTVKLIEDMSGFLQEWDEQCEDIVRNPTR